MDNSIINFCKKYEEKLKTDKDIAERELDFFQDYRDRINFRISAYSNNFHTRYMFPYFGESLFFLDEEDLKYLYEKYSKKLQDEMNKNIEQVKQMYRQS